ncbi:RHS repeat-associated core domain-containing protein [Escherichia coli]|uniref:RHS repeat-associated core domain-containing protein n=1 Tax=Escherichia coli TaxID=562 RepID=UPI003F5CC662
MSGKPAARQGDMTQYGGSIVQGSAGVQSQHLNSLQYDRDYTWNDNGELIRISSPRQTRSYSYSTTGRLTSVHTTAANLDIRIPYATDPAGNRLPDPELHPDSTLSMWPDNRIARDAHYLYRYDRYGRLTEKTDLIPEGVIRTDDERTHQYHYDSQHRLVHYTRTQYAEPLVESRYLYDPLGRRVAKRVWRRERDLTGWMSLSRKPEVTWYGWDGDRLTTIQNDRTRIQTIYQPGSFTPLIRVETATGELAKTQRRSLADTLQQSGGEDGGSVVFPPVLVQMLDRLESEILADRVSEESRRWLASCGLTVAQMQSQMDPVYTPARKIHLYHCDHRGLPLALISTEGTTAWYAEYDEWGNLLNEENPHQLQQLIRLPGQQYDEESGLYYNRHRYYDPLQGRYITQDPIGLKGGWNFYQYPLNPISNIDPLGLETLKCIKPLHSMGGTGERSGPDIWGNPFYHQYLCVPDGKGDYTCGGQDQRGESKGDGLWGPGKASNDTKEAAGRCDLVETDNSCVENCLKGKFKEVRPRYSVLPDIFTPINLGLFKNCQDWSNDSLETCKMKCSGNNIGRFIRFVFTGVM